MKNEGHMIYAYVPARYFDLWNHIMYSTQGHKFVFRTVGVPLGMEKNASHEYVEAKCFFDEELS